MIKQLNAFLVGGLLASFISIVIFGTGILEDYDSYECNIGNLDDSVDPTVYKLSAQILFIVCVGVSVSLKPRPDTESNVAVWTSIFISLGLAVTAFMCAYAGATTTCTKMAKADGTVDDLTEIELAMTTKGSISLASSFLALSVILALFSHDIYESQGGFYFAYSHWPSFLDVSTRIIGLVLLLVYVGKDENMRLSGADFVSASNNTADDTNCMAAIDKLHEDDATGILFSNSDKGFKTFLMATVILCGIEIFARFLEFVGKTSKMFPRLFMMFNVIIRLHTVFSRVAIGIVIFSLIMTNELVMCQAYHINEEFRVAVGFLLMSIFTAVAQIMLVQQDNRGIREKGGDEDSIRIADAPSGTQSPLYSSLFMS